MSKFEFDWESEWCEEPDWSAWMTVEVAYAAR